MNIKSPIPFKHECVIIALLFVLLGLDLTGAVPGWIFWAGWSCYAVLILWVHILVPLLVKRGCSNDWRTDDDRRPFRPCDCPRCDAA